MSELDPDRLEGVHAWAERQIEAEERRRRLAPLWEAMRESISSLQRDTFPEIQAEPEAMKRRNVLEMERSQREFPATLVKRDADRKARLDRLRARTEGLRLWLEALA